MFIYVLISFRNMQVSKIVENRSSKSLISLVNQLVRTLLIGQLVFYRPGAIVSHLHSSHLVLSPSFFPSSFTKLSPKVGMAALWRLGFPSIAASAHDAPFHGHATATGRRRMVSQQKSERNWELTRARALTRRRRRRLPDDAKNPRDHRC